MLRRIIVALALPIGIAACHGGSTHYEPNAFVWNGTIPQGGWLRLRNIQGDLVVEPTTDSEASVQVALRWRGHRGSVHFVQGGPANDVVICTMYDEGSCTPDQYRTKRTKHWGLFGDESAEYVVRLPAGVGIDANTVLGAVRIVSNGGDVRARTVNGSVSVAAGKGAVTAQSVNGSVRVSIDSAGAPGAVALETVNGSVTAELPASAGAAVNLETVNGHITSAFPIATADSGSSHERHGTIGTGGREVSLKTVNGSIRLLRRG